MDIQKELDKVAKKLNHIQNELYKRDEEEKYKDIQKEFDKVIGKMSMNEPINVGGLKVRLTEVSSEQFGSKSLSIEGRIIGLAD